MSAIDYLKIYYFMRLTRAMEDRIRTLFLQGRIVGGVYTAQGHEATTVGAAMTNRNILCSSGPHLMHLATPPAHS